MPVVAVEGVDVKCTGRVVGVLEVAVGVDAGAVVGVEEGMVVGVEEGTVVGVLEVGAAVTAARREVGVLVAFAINAPLV